MGLDWQNNSFARASCFFVHFLAVVARLQLESASFHVLSRTGTQDNEFYFLSWTLIQSFRIQLQKKLPTFEELNRWTKRETVWSRATVLFQWRFRGRRRPCCLSSLSWNETGVKEPLTTVRWKGHDVIVYLTWDIIGLGGRGEIKYGLKRLHSAPLHGDVGFYLSAIGCKWESCFVDCCKKRKYTCKPVSAYDSLERQDRKIFRNVSK